MILLDTNVLSELMRPAPNPAVVGWVAAQPREALYTASIVQAEILYGVALLPDGRRKTELAAAVASMFAEEFAGRVLPFDDRAAPHYADIVARRRTTGQPIEAFDALIAATARAAGASVATRDVGGFSECGIDLIDPWQTQGPKG